MGSVCTIAGIALDIAYSIVYNIVVGIVCSLMFITYPFGFCRSRYLCQCRYRCVDVNIHAITDKMGEMRMAAGYSVGFNGD